MKIIVIVCLLLLGLNKVSVGQNCLPGGITFNSQKEIDSFLIKYPDCKVIDGDIELQTRSGIFPITNLRGLSNIIKINGSFSLVFDSNLKSLEGIESLKIIEGNLIFAHSSINNCKGLDNLIYVGGDLEIDYISTLFTLDGLERLKRIGGNFHFQSNFTRTFKGLDSLRQIGGDFNVIRNPGIPDFIGFEQLESIGGKLEIDGNDYIKNLDGLDNLKSVKKGLVIKNNKLLDNIDGTLYLSKLGGPIWISRNTKLKSIDGLRYVEKKAFKTKEREILFLFGNPLLSNCSLNSICDILQIPFKEFYIEGNKVGCNDINEVLNKCLDPVQDHNNNINLSVYPNPSKGIIFVESDLPNDEFSIISQNGIVLMKHHHLAISTTIDLQELKPGLYFIQSKSGQIKRIIKN